MLCVACLRVRVYSLRVWCVCLDEAHLFDLRKAFDDFRHELLAVVTLQDHRSSEVVHCFAQGVGHAGRLLGPQELQE